MELYMYSVVATLLSIASLPHEGHQQVELLIYEHKE